MNKNEKYFKCQCSGEAIFVEKYKIEDLPCEYWFTLYRLGNYNPNMINRIKWAWKILRTGRLHTDEVTFSEETTIELRDFLTDLINRGKRI